MDYFCRLVRCRLQWTRFSNLFCHWIRIFSWSWCRLYYLFYQLFRHSHSFSVIGYEYLHEISVACIICWTNCSNTHIHLSHFPLPLWIHPFPRMLLVATRYISYLVLVPLASDLVCTYRSQYLHVHFSLYFQYTSTKSHLHCLQFLHHFNLLYAALAAIQKHGPLSFSVYDSDSCVVHYVALWNTFMHATQLLWLIMW